MGLIAAARSDARRSTEATRSSPEVVRALDFAWSALSSACRSSAPLRGSNGGAITSMGQAGFLVMMRKLYLALKQDAELDPADCSACALKDWGAAAGRRASLSKEDLKSLWFQLADEHADGVLEPGGCASWITDVVAAITKPIEVAAAGEAAREAAGEAAPAPSAADPTAVTAPPAVGHAWRPDAELLDGLRSKVQAGSTAFDRRASRWTAWFDEAAASDEASERILEAKRLREEEDAIRVERAALAVCPPGGRVGGAGELYNAEGMLILDSRGEIVFARDAQYDADGGGEGSGGGAGPLSGKGVGGVGGRRSLDAIASSRAPLEARRAAQIEAARAAGGMSPGGIRAPAGALSAHSQATGGGECRASGGGDGGAGGGAAAKNAVGVSFGGSGAVGRASSSPYMDHLPAPPSSPAMALDSLHGSLVIESKQPSPKRSEMSAVAPVRPNQRGKARGGHAAGGTAAPPIPPPGKSPTSAAAAVALGGGPSTTRQHLHRQGAGGGAEGARGESGVRAAQLRSRADGVATLSMSHMVLSGVRGAGRGAGATGRGAMAAPSTASNFSPLRSPAGHLMDWERRFDGGIMRWKRLARRVPAPPADEVSYRRSGMAAPPSSPSKPTAAAFWWGKASCAHADADATHAASNTMAADGADEGAAARKQSSKFLAEANADDESQASADGQPHDTAVNRSARPAHYGLMNLEPGLDPASAATGSLVAPPNDSGTSGTQRPAAERVPTADARSRGRPLPSALGARGGAGARGMSFLPTKAIPSAPPPLEQRPSGVGFIDASGVLRYRRRREFAMDPQLQQLDGRHSGAEAIGRLVATPPYGPPYSARSASPRQAPNGRSSPRLHPPHPESAHMASLLSKEAAPLQGGPVTFFTTAVE